MCRTLSAGRRRFRPASKALTAGCGPPSPGSSAHRERGFGLSLPAQPAEASGGGHAPAGCERHVWRPEPRLHREHRHGARHAGAQRLRAERQRHPERRVGSRLAGPTECVGQPGAIRGAGQWPVGAPEHRPPGAECAAGGRHGGCPDAAIRSSGTRGDLGAVRAGPHFRPGSEAHWKPDGVGRSGRHGQRPSERPHRLHHPGERPERRGADAARPASARRVVCSAAP